MRTIRRVVSLLCLLIFTSAIALAQLSTGSLSGTITDQAGAAVSGAKVTVKHDTTGRQFDTTTSSVGLYSFPNLDVGPYTITIEASGFKRLTQTGAVIAIASKAVVDLKVEVGNVDQTVTVTAEAPLLATQTSDIGTSFQPKLFKDAPLFFGGGVRNPESFIAFMPGVNNGSGDSSINGGPRRAKEILIDGAGATIPESGGVIFQFTTVEQFGEFKLITNSFAAEYGRTGGGIEVFTTASGGNSYHGTVYDFHRNSSLDAAAWALNANPNPALRVKPKFRQNEYGAAIGGPIYLPKKVFGPIGGYNEDRSRSFFFFTYGGFRQNAVATPTFVTVPTLKQRQGDFSELGRNIYDPATGLQFPGNIIPQGRFSAVSRAILPLIPLPTTNTLTNNYIGLATSTRMVDSWSLKINHNITSKHLVNFWINRLNSIPDLQGPLPSPLTNNAVNDSQRPRFYRFNYDYLITPRLNLHATYGMTRHRQIWTTPAVGQGWPTKIGLKGVTEGETDSFPVVEFLDRRYEGYAQTGGVGAVLHKNKGSQLNPTDHLRFDLSWTKGRHQMKFGFDKRWLGTNGIALPSGVFDDASGQGVFRFSPQQTASRTIANTGDSFASFLLGAVNNALRSVNAAADEAQFGYNAFYAQTDWKFSPKLTLNLGLRYDIPIPRSTRNDTFSAFDPNLVNPAAGGLKGALAYSGEGAGRTGESRFAGIDYSSVAPRLGFAYAVNDKTVIRGGYGIYYSAGNGLTGGFCIPCSLGFTTSLPQLTSPDSFTPGLYWDNGFQPPPGYIAPPFIAPSFANGQSLLYINPKSGQAPRIHNYNLNIQREIGRFLFDIAYTGSRGTRLSSFRDPLNALDPKYLALGSLLDLNIADARVVAAGYTRPYASFNGTLAQALRPYPQFLNINGEYDPIGRSWYDSLQIKVERRYSALTLQTSYVWSKSLTDATGTQTTGNPSGFNLRSQNPLNDKAEKSYLYADWPHVLNVLWSYDLPFGRGKRFLSSSNGFVNRVLGGWTLSGVQQYRTGALIQVTVPTTGTSIFGSANFDQRKRPNVTGQPFLTGVDRTKLDPRDSNSRWLNRAAFGVIPSEGGPGTYEYGNAANFYGDLRQPPVFIENFSLIKRTAITETVNFEFRTEISNIFNRTCFGGVNGNLQSPDFGRPSGPQVGARIIQMAAKINF